MALFLCSFLLAISSIIVLYAERVKDIHVKPVNADKQQWNDISVGRHQIFVAIGGEKDGYIGELRGNQAPSRKVPLSGNFVAVEQDEYGNSVAVVDSCNEAGFDTGPQNAKKAVGVWYRVQHNYDSKFKPADSTPRCYSAVVLADHFGLVLAVPGTIAGKDEHGGIFEMNHNPEEGLVYMERAAFNRSGGQYWNSAAISDDGKFKFATSVQHVHRDPKTGNTTTSSSHIAYSINSVWKFVDRIEGVSAQEFEHKNVTSVDCDITGTIAVVAVSRATSGRLTQSAGYLAMTFNSGNSWTKLTDPAVQNRHFTHVSCNDTCSLIVATYLADGAAYIAFTVNGNVPDSKWESFQVMIDASNPLRGVTNTAVFDGSVYLISKYAGIVVGDLPLEAHPASELPPSNDHGGQHCYSWWFWLLVGFVVGVLITLIAPAVYAGICKRPEYSKDGPDPEEPKPKPEPESAQSGEKMPLLPKKISAQSALADSHQPHNDDGSTPV